MKIGTSKDFQLQNNKIPDPLIPAVVMKCKSIHTRT